MKLEKEIIERKEYKTTTRVYFSNSYQMDILPTEYIVQHSYIPKTGQYITITREFKEIGSEKNSNFVDEVRALTKENESKPFTQKHEYLAKKISKAAKKGYHSCSFMLDDSEIEDLIAEGFIVQRGVDCPSQISW